MKLLFVTCLQEHKSEVTKIFHEAKVKVFSVTETTGIKDERDTNLLDDWFGNKDGEYDSLILFSFTDNDTARSAMEGIRKYNQVSDTAFPIRAFILPIEEASYSL